MRHGAISILTRPNIAFYLHFGVDILAGINYYIPTMNDITWHILDEQGMDLLGFYPDSKVLVLTDVTYRIDTARYIDTWRRELTTAKELVIKFAFIGE